MLQVRHHEITSDSHLSPLARMGDFNHHLVNAARLDREVPKGLDRGARNQIGVTLLFEDSK